MKELDIGELSALAGVAPSALRFYEMKGLIKPIGRSGLRRQYPEYAVSKLQLIAAGQIAGFTLDEMATMFGEPHQRHIDRDALLSRAQQIDETVQKLQMLSMGLKHVAKCREEDPMECAEFRRVVARGLRLGSGDKHNG
ncbi:MerR family transcriptional regulator [Pluralibacter gergoviae]|uniref:MerR family transcriptional regulator n=1 Tax=Pluralibacter gergoviae TaxID=61647 RepID=A0AAI9DNW5_PLUGE|nr:MerR family transcriptional regulator [Pluralibacter gergoviae]EKV0916877.1 MerR family transcriptional regulator [Pluralibacter gergoviae]EKV9909963.1 MerR family transcriptional regulator [Pluralibacter gergoviae]EKW7277191.1 MerR family transcriptional regulator [Pluralibacter gergoviae]ELD4297486.1 MerR family transcriptional regulator [Pluralibacter gergoviae]ELD4308233.1 MerR family transcriptional regulator [Pluralibacter gergoviae]